MKDRAADVAAYGAQLDALRAWVMRGPDRATWSERRTKHFLGITGFYKEAPAVFRPYIQANQKIENASSSLLELKRGEQQRRSAC
ncbi:hypothetical protein ACKWRH_37160 [Bradyrhizobium sp. Pa8]|uniref:hypothetical protein n=1 Tax=Bradyrhizobium sp. Pa8 TaxID=3386552 RepID=UPI00403F9316